jgi:hypothetical protein
VARQNCSERIRDRLEGRIPTRWRPSTRQINGFLTSPSADLILVGGSGKRLIWPGGGVWPPGGIHDFTDEFFEDVFEGDHGLGLAVLVDEAGEVRAAGTQGCERGLQGGGGPDFTEGADPAVVHRQVPAGLVGVQDVGDVDITTQVRSGMRSVISLDREAGVSGGGDKLLDTRRCDIWVDSDQAVQR